MNATRCGRTFARLLGAAVATALALLSVPIDIPLASADLCPDVEVVFARGTDDPPGVGTVGQAFVDSLRSQIGTKTVNVYPVNYPASNDYPTAADGVIDGSRHVESTAANCPGTRMVLGGFSQGAAVIGYITADAIPEGYTAPAGITGPMPTQVADHVAAVALIARPSSAFLSRIDAPTIVIGHLYTAKTIDVCNPDDPICSPDGNNVITHIMYTSNGMVNKAADFAARSLV
jgi:cutinase